MHLQGSHRLGISTTEKRSSNHPLDRMGNDHVGFTCVLWFCEQRKSLPKRMHALHHCLSHSLNTFGRNARFVETRSDLIKKVVGHDSPYVSQSPTSMNGAESGWRWCLFKTEYSQSLRAFRYSVLDSSWGSLCDSRQSSTSTAQSSLAPLPTLSRRRMCHTRCPARPQRSLCDPFIRKESADMLRPK